jgi:Amidohydrolase
MLQKGQRCRRSKTKDEEKKEVNNNPSEKFHGGVAARIIRGSLALFGAFLVLAAMFFSASAAAQEAQVLVNTGNPDGKLGALSRRPSVNKTETETADDFALKQTTVFTGATIVGLVSAATPLANIANVEVELQTNDYDFNDSHCHLTNNIQEGPSVRDFLSMMGNRVGRATLFGVPLQQEWLYGVDGDRAPTYYLHSDAPLYYYSFTDAWIAMAYKSLPKEQQARFDPMITGFNPTDMYAADHIRRVLQTFPGVFSGIGEFTIHKEFVSAKIPGEVASLQNPALDRILDFAAEVGLVVILHNDIDVPIAKGDAEPAYLEQLKAVFKRHRNTTIIWAHMGLGRLVAPPQGHLAKIEAILSDRVFQNVYVDISWDEVAKYFVSSEDATKGLSELMRRYPDRFLFGTDSPAPADQSKYLKVYYQYQLLWKALDPETSRKVRLQNYERIFDSARRNVRSWEKAHVSAGNAN